MFDRIYLDLLRKINAAPDVYLGGKSLTLLEAFHFGYCFFRPDVPSEDVVIVSVLREARSRRYRLDVGTLGVFDIVRRISENEARAFDLFIGELEATVIQHPEVAGRRPARFL